jgi:hypothetical protein
MHSILQLDNVRKRNLLGPLVWNPNSQLMRAAVEPQSTTLSRWRACVVDLQSNGRISFGDDPRMRLVI